MDLPSSSPSFINPMDQCRSPTDQKPKVDDEDDQDQVAEPDDDQSSIADIPNHQLKQIQPDRQLLITVHVDVCMKSTCTNNPGAIEARTYAFVRDSTAFFSSGALNVSEDSILSDLISYANISIPDGMSCVPFWSANISIHVFQLHDDPVAEEMTDNDDDVVACQIHSLPSTEFDQLWENIIFESNIKEKLINYASTAMQFADLKVNPKIISLNRMILLHGPPGSGKTSLSIGLAQMLSIRLSDRFQHCQLVNINAHSLFSKWFSESGKIVLKLFQRIHDLVSDPTSLVVLLIDEVESLASARQAALSGSEPSDSIRAVNALLTQLDQLRSYSNVFICCTSNLSQAIDLAFLDRADIKLFVDNPSEPARFEIVRSCINELIRIGVIAGDSMVILPYNEAVHEPSHSNLIKLVGNLQGKSGRALRRLPIQAQSLYLNRIGTQLDHFIEAMNQVANHNVDGEQGM